LRINDSKERCRILNSLQIDGCSVQIALWTALVCQTCLELRKINDRTRAPLNMNIFFTS